LTFVAIAIVLVIVRLLVGGLLKGQETLTGPRVENLDLVLGKRLIRRFHFTILWYAPSGVIH